jgi:hypothetical protein
MPHVALLYSASHAWVFSFAEVWAVSVVEVTEV